MCVCVFVCVCACVFVCLINLIHGMRTSGDMLLKCGSTQRPRERKRERERGGEREGERVIRKFLSDYSNISGN